MLDVHVSHLANNFSEYQHLPCLAGDPGPLFPGRQLLSVRMRLAHIAL